MSLCSQSVTFCVILSLHAVPGQGRSRNEDMWRATPPQWTLPHSYHGRPEVMITARSLVASGAIGLVRTGSVSLLTLVSRLFQRVRLCGEGGGGHVRQDQLHHHQGAGTGLPRVIRALAAARKQSEPQMATKRPQIHPRHRPKERRGGSRSAFILFLCHP